MYLLPVKDIMISITCPSVNANEFVFCRCHRPWWKYQQSLHRFNESVRGEYDKMPQADTPLFQEQLQGDQRGPVQLWLPSHGQGAKHRLIELHLPPITLQDGKNFLLNWISHIGINNMWNTLSLEQLSEIFEVKVRKLFEKSNKFYPLIVESVAYKAYSKEVISLKGTNKKPYKRRKGVFNKQMTTLCLVP